MERYALKRGLQIFQIRWNGTPEGFKSISDWVPCTEMHASSDKVLHITSPSRTRPLDVTPGSYFSVIKRDSTTTVSTTTDYFISRLATIFDRQQMAPGVFQVQLPAEGYMFDALMIKPDTLEKDLKEEGLTYDSATNMLILKNAARFYLVDNDYLVKMPGKEPFYLSVPRWFVREYCSKITRPLRGTTALVGNLDDYYIVTIESTGMGYRLPAREGEVYITEETFRKYYSPIMNSNAYAMNETRLHAQGILTIRDFDFVLKALGFMKAGVTMSVVDDRTRRYAFPDGTYAVVSVGMGVVFDRRMMLIVPIKDLMTKLNIGYKRTKADDFWDKLMEMDVVALKKARQARIEEHRASQAAKAARAVAAGEVGLLQPVKRADDGSYVLPDGTRVQGAAGAVSEASDAKEVTRTAGAVEAPAAETSVVETPAVETNTTGTAEVVEAEVVAKITEDEASSEEVSGAAIEAVSEKASEDKEQSDAGLNPGNDIDTDSVAGLEYANESED